MATVIAGKYEVLDQLGAGGMGVVYKVRHLGLRHVLRALKVLPSHLMEHPEMVERFRQEVEVMASLGFPDAHPNIVKVYDFDRDEDRNWYYIVMEYIEGKTLKEYVKEKGPLPLPEVLEITRQAASALAFAHKRELPIVHRDIKPANIMIEDRSKRVVVMDYGIAKELGRESDRTKTGMIIGTLKYSAPEQLRQEPLDGRADIYSLGMVMYEMYTGQQFFAGLGENDVLGKVLYNPQENQPQFPPSTPPAVAKLITTAIAKDRQRRYQRVEDLLRDMEALPSNLAWQDEKTEIFSPPSPDSGRRREEIKEKEQPTSQLPEVQPPAPKPSTRLPSLFWSGLALAVVTVVFLSIFRPFEKVLIPSAPPPSSPPLSQSEPRFAAPPAPLPSASSSPSAKQDVQEASSVTPPPLPLQMQGYLQVNVNVDTAEVSVDGRSVGVTRRDKPLEIRDLAVGKVRVRVEAEGYEPLERPVSVELNKWAQEAFVLNRLPAPEKTLAAPTSPNTEAPAIVQSAPQPQPEEQSSDEIVTFWTLDPSGQLVPQTQPAKSPQSRKKMQGK